MRNRYSENLGFDNFYFHLYYFYDIDSLLDDCSRKYFSYSSTCYYNVYQYICNTVNALDNRNFPVLMLDVRNLKIVGNFFEILCVT